MTPEQNARLDRIEHHLKLIKESDIKRGQTLTNIEHALIGNEMNGNKGLVADFEDIKKSFKTQNEEVIILKNELANAKFWGKITATGLVMGLIGVLFKLFIK